MVWRAPILFSHSLMPLIFCPLAALTARPSVLGDVEERVMEQFYTQLVYLFTTKFRLNIFFGRRRLLWGRKSFCARHTTLQKLARIEFPTWMPNIAAVRSRLIYCANIFQSVLIGLQHLRPMPSAFKTSFQASSIITLNCTS